MKKYLPYILSLLLLAAVIILFATGNNKPPRRMDERVTLRKSDKIPYGTYVAYENLKYLFPAARVYTSRQEPGYWDSLSSTDSGQAFISIAFRFNADESEIKNLVDFAKKGNDVFVSASEISSTTRRLLECQVYAQQLYYNPEDGWVTSPDSIRVSLSDPPFAGNPKYAYPGKNFSRGFTRINRQTTDVLGKDEREAQRDNFIRLRAGRGNFYLHLAPLAFSNYFLLHKENAGYYERALSVISPGVKKIVWDEYYLYKRPDTEEMDEEKQSNSLSVLFRYPSLKAGLLTGIFTLLLFVLLEMRRKQRYIPVVTRPRNDSLDFVRTIGRLYYDKGDHLNLCRKMAAYFLEHVRLRYKLATASLDDQFTRQLQFKSGVEETEIRGIVAFIKHLEQVPEVTNHQLAGFHKKLESFYKKA